MYLRMLSSWMICLDILFATIRFRMAASSNDPAKIGAVETMRSHCFRAHLQRRANNGCKEHIHGPKRNEKRKAELDLDSIRHAAEESEDAWGSMVAVAHRLQDRAKFEVEVSLCAETCMAAKDDAHENTQPCDTQTCESQICESQLYDSEPGDSQEYYNDRNELWQEIDDEGNLPESYVYPPVIPVPPVSDSLQATALLSKFRPARMTVEDLGKILAARADPNINLGGGDIHPLMKVIVEGKTIAPILK